MDELVFKSGERVLNSNQIGREYVEMVAAVLAEEDADNSRTFILNVPLEEQTDSWVVETGLDESVFFAAVHNSRSQLSRFVAGRSPGRGPAELHIQMKWRDLAEGSGYLIKSVTKGVYVATPVWDQDNVTPQDKLWWQTHAYIFDNRNVELQDSYTWRCGYFNCYACRGRAARRTSQQHGSLLFCARCSGKVQPDAPTQRIEIGGWKCLNVPTILLKYR